MAELSTAERDVRMLSFAWANVAFENPAVTHQMVYDAFCRLYGREPLAVPEEWDISIPA